MEHSALNFLPDDLADDLTSGDDERPQFAESLGQTPARPIGNRWLVDRVQAPEYLQPGDGTTVAAAIPAAAAMTPTIQTGREIAGSWGTRAVAFTVIQTTIWLVLGVAVPLAAFTYGSRSGAARHPAVRDHRRRAGSHATREDRLTL